MTTMATSPDRYLNVARGYRPTPVADGGLYFASDMAGLPQTYRIDGADRFPVRVAPSQNRTLPVAQTPFGMLLRHDHDGNEIWQLSMLTEGGDLRQLTDDPRAIHRGVVPTPDGLRAGLAFNPEGRADWALGVIDLETGSIGARVDRGGYWSWLAWDGDGEVAVVAEALGNVANRAYLLRGAELQPLLSSATLVEDAFWAGGRLYLIADVDSEYQGLVEVDPAEPDRIARWLIREEHDVSVAVPAPDGRRALVAVNAGPYDQLRILDLESGESQPIDLQPGLITADNVVPSGENVAWSGERLLVAWESSSRPADIIEPDTGRRWTFAGGGGFPELPAPAAVAIESLDGLAVPALHYRVDGTPRPTVVYFHGGPESETRASFTPQVAMWIGAGFDVVAPNVRGSTGYGRHYFSLDDRGLRWDAVRDGCAVGRWAKEHGGATSLVAMGGSYGGFMTLAVLVEDPGLWDFGVDIVGIADWHSFLRNTSGWRRSMRVAEYGEPEGPDGEFLAEFSPLRRADRITARLLIIHGRNDPRVPVGEAEQIHHAVSGSELLILDDEGHGLTKHGNRSRAYGRAVEFVRAGLGH